MANSAIDTAIPAKKLFPAIAGVYTTQSTLGAIIFMGLPAVLRELGVGLDKIGVLYLLMLPWALKFLWAPLVERYRLTPTGERRSRQIILFGQSLMILSVLSIALLDPAHLSKALVAALVFATVIATGVDIACDGFAIEQIKRSSHSWGNVMQVGGGYLGMMLGGGLFLLLIDMAGWSIGICLIALLLFCLSMPMLFIKEPAIALSSHNTRPSLINAIKRPEIQWGLAVVVVFQLGLRLSMSLLSPFLVDRGFDLTTIGLVSGVAGTITSVIGVIAAGIIVKRFGTNIPLSYLIKLQLMLYVGFAAVAFVPELPKALVILLLVLNALITGACFVALYTAMMNWSSNHQAGVDFTVFQSMDAVLMVFAGFGSNMLSHHFGYGYIFSLAAALAVIASILLPRILTRLENSIK